MGFLLDALGKAVHAFASVFVQEKKMSSAPKDAAAMMAPVGLFVPAIDYMIDTLQRGVLFCDVMRQRGNQYREHLAETVPHVLDYQVELVIDGRKLNRPVNYALARVVPPAGVTID